MSLHAQKCGQGICDVWPIYSASAQLLCCTFLKAAVLCIACWAECLFKWSTRIPWSNNTKQWNVQLDDAKSQRLSKQQ